MQSQKVASLEEFEKCSFLKPFLLDSMQVRRVLEVRSNSSCNTGVLQYQTHGGAASMRISDKTQKRVSLPSRQRCLHPLEVKCV